MSDDKPLVIDLKAKGVLPAKFAGDAAGVLKGNKRVEIEPSAAGLTLRGVWEFDVEHAIEELREATGFEIECGPPRVLYQDERHQVEPVMRVRLSVPDDSVGKVVGDLSLRRASILEVGGGDDGNNRIDGLVPLANLFGYFGALMQVTAGRGKIDVEFHAYQPVPPSGPDSGPGGCAVRDLRAGRTG